MTYVYALALICAAGMEPQDCTRETAIGYAPVTSVEVNTPGGCANAAMHMLAATRLPGRERYVKIVCEERKS